MKSQANIVATQVRLQEWAEMIKECNRRPVGMNVETWCEQHNITAANYYYRLRRVREACIMYADEKQLQTNHFVELSAPSDEKKDTPITSQVCASISMTNGIEIHLTNTASSDFLQNILEACSHVK